MNAISLTPFPHFCECLSLLPALQQLNVEVHEEEETVTRKAGTTLPSLGIPVYPTPSPHHSLEQEEWPPHRKQGSSEVGAAACEFSSVALAPQLFEGLVR